MSGDVESRAVVGRCAHVGKSGSKVDAGVHCDSLEWGESLVVVHCKHSVKLAVGLGAEESVGGIRTECEYLFIAG